jgi:hypothetical protein
MYLSNVFRVSPLMVLQMPVDKFPVSTCHFDEEKYGVIDTIGFSCFAGTGNGALIWSIISLTCCSFELAEQLKKVLP